MRRQFWNRRRVSAVLIVVLLGLLLAAVKLSSDTADGQQPSGGGTVTVAPGTPGATLAPTRTTPRPTPARPTPARPSTQPADEHGEHHRPDARPVHAATVSYLSTFLDPRMPEKTWRARLAALSTPTHSENLATVPRAVVPRVGLRSVTVTRLASSAAAAAGVLTDGTVLVVALVLTADGWRVSRVVPQTNTSGVR